MSATYRRPSTSYASLPSRSRVIQATQTMKRCDELAEAQAANSSLTLLQLVDGYRWMGEK